MEDPDSNHEVRLKHLRNACVKHQQMYKDAMNGYGIDRHLFALYVICKGLGYVSVPPIFPMSTPSNYTPYPSNYNPSKAYFPRSCSLKNAPFQAYYRSPRFQMHPMRPPP